ncbi:hypothetical protein TIFTF001_001738 [Ficus carica]|uniref:Transmembrane protein n=1 Tax=Ficus carica TaxID=3494 RepID=A0AA88D5I9_FICCA|nr:hypothetical protein TIFTF001_001738 [Ficus carica]
MDVCHVSNNNNNNNNNIVSKNAMKLLLSVSAFSIMVSYSSLLFPFLINSLLDVYVSAFTKQSFSSTLEKNCVFLLCNGLLVIIVTNSGLIGKSPQPDTSSGGIIVGSSPLALQQVGLENDVEDDDDVKNGSLQIVTLEREEEEEEEEEEEVEEQELLDEEDEMENGIIIYEDYYDEEEEGTIGLPSKEEFNKICEDFIRRVKEEIKCGRR